MVDSELNYQLSIINYHFQWQDHTAYNKYYHLHIGCTSLGIKAVEPGAFSLREVPEIIIDTLGEFFGCRGLKTLDHCSKGSRQPNHRWLTQKRKQDYTLYAVLR